MKNIRKAVFNFFVDGVSLMVLTGMIATGFVMQFRLLPGFKGGQGWTIWGMTRHDWGAIHFYLALSFLALMALHVFLHWRWVWAIVTGHGGPGSALRRNVFLLATLAFLLLAGVPWLMPVDKSGAGQGEGRRGEGGPYRGGPGAGMLAPGAHEAPAIEPASAASGTADTAGASGTGAIALRGSVTLAEAAAMTGIDLPTLIQRLGLPADTPANERLGRSMRGIGLTMNDARERLGLPAEEH